MRQHARRVGINETELVQADLVHIDRLDAEGAAGVDVRNVAAGIVRDQHVGVQVGRPQDLKAVEYTMLALIQANPGVSPARLRKALCLSAPYVTSSLEKLHTRGFILREVNQQDRRGQHLRVTRAAERLVAELTQTLLAAERAREALVFFAGGPGQPSVPMAGGAAQRYGALRRDRDLLFIDQRGTGESAPLQCRLRDPADPQSYLADYFPPDAVARCLDELRRGADLSRYGYPQLAHDVEAVRAALGYERLDLWGGSYGTRAALVYMRQHPERVREALRNRAHARERPRGALQPERDLHGLHRQDVDGDENDP